MEYGKVETPQPVTIYDKNPPMAVRLMNIEEVPIASSMEKPKRDVKIAMRNTPPPTPKSPDENPTSKPIIPMEIKLNGILASSFSLLRFKKLLTAMKSNKHPKMISNIFDGSPEATKPPMTPPTIPKAPNFNPGSIIPSMDLECLYAPLSDVGMIIAKLVPKEISIAKSEFTPICCNKKYWRGTIRNPPPTPNNPDAKPAQIPINISPMKYSTGNTNITYLKY